MVLAADYRRLGLGLLAVAATAVLVWFGTGLHPFWPLLWFAPLPVLLYANGATALGATLVAAAAWPLGNFNMWHYLHDSIGMPLAALLAIYVSETVVFAIAIGLYRALLRSGLHWMAVLAVPATWVSFEYLLNITSPHGTASDLAYSQLEFLPFLQLASLTGPWGMTFLLLLFPAALAVGFHLRVETPKRALRIVSASLGVIFLVLTFGAVRLQLPAATHPVKVGLIASDAPTSPQLAEEGAAATSLFQAYAEQAVKLAADGAQVIVLPEKLAVAVDPATHDMDNLFQSLANNTGTRIVVGLIHVSSP